MTRLAACPTCTAPLRAGLRFCTRCGAALVAVTDARIAPPAPAPSVAPALHDLPDFDVAADFSTPADAEHHADRDADLGVDEAPVFEPVPALGPLAPAPAERPSILGLLAIPEPQPAQEPAPGPDPTPATEPEPAPPAPAPTQVLAPGPAPLPAVDAPQPAAPAAVEHPLGVPVISARRAPGPGADPTHIGRATAYGQRTSTVAATGATLTASPASASPASPEPRTPEPATPEPTTQPAARAPRRYSPPPARSRVATWALITGILPLLVSIAGNLITAELGRQAVLATEAGVTSGAWSPVFVSLSVVFVINAALLTLCAIAGSRGIRETSNGITKGRALAVSGLAAGAVNLVLLVAGLVISISSLSAVLA